jgi:hypothetical protein
MIGELVLQGPPLSSGLGILFVRSNIGAVGTCAFRTRLVRRWLRNHGIRLTIVHEFVGTRNIASL